jgi:spore coat polysaccharide biosynthesis predicted glycosyltransferase SpsG
MNIFFYCNSNQKVGYGHFKRCLSLARWMKNETLLENIVFVGDYDAHLLNEIENYCFRSIDFSLRLINDSREIYSIFSNADYVIIDSYDIDQNFVNELTSLKHLQSVIIDDFNNLELSDFYQIINFTINAGNCNYKNTNKSLGTDYLIVKPELSDIRIKNISKIIEPVSSILIFLSGTGLGNHLIEEISTAINSCLKHQNVFVISIEFQAHSLKLMGTNSFHYIPICNNIEEYLNNIDLVICGGGLMKYESCFSCVPTAVISLNEEQYDDTLGFLEKHLCYDLGLLKQNKLNNLESNLGHFLKNQKLHNQLKMNCIHHFKTDSTKFLIEKIFTSKTVLL